MGSERGHQWGTTWAIIAIGSLAVILLLERLKWLIVMITATAAPFFVAFLLAFMLNPLMARLEKRGLSRVCSVVVTSLLFLAVFAVGVFLVLPQFVTQGADFVSSIPAYARALEKGIDNFLVGQKALLQRVSLPTSIAELIKRFPDEMRQFSTAALNVMSHFVLAVVSKVTWLVVVPLVTVWLLINWNAQREAIYRQISDVHRERFVRVTQCIAGVLNSYVRGTIVVAVLYGVVTTVILGLIFRMPYALILGLIAGLVSPIPYVGSIIILLSTGIVAYATNPSLGYVVAVISAMVVQNNILFDNLVAPRVLGGAVGLNLPWSLFALMLGGSMFGIAGMLIAVPVGATIRVIILELMPKAPKAQSDNKHPERQGGTEETISHTT